MAVSHQRVRGTAAVLLLVLLAADVALSVAARDPWPTNDGLVLVMLAAYAAVGYVIARTQPRNPIGWIFLALAISAFVDYVARLYLVLDYRERGGSLPLGAAVMFWRGSWTIFPFLLAFPAIVLFPYGFRCGGAECSGPTPPLRPRSWSCSATARRWTRSPASGT